MRIVKNTPVEESGRFTFEAPLIELVKELKRLNELLETHTVKEDGELMFWARDHYWDSLEREKSMILKHLESFRPTSPSNSEKEIPCLCPAWFEDGKGGWIKNTRKDHVKGECPLANVEEQPTTPEKECCENCNGKKNQSNSISSVCSGHCLCHKS